MSFELYDTVRIARVLIPDRDVDGSAADPPQPRVGETGVIVTPLGDCVYLVERSTDDGRTQWMAEFLEDELELVERRATCD
jgi:hypothetical protein